jgi:SAM-dependent methyltransferase
MKISDIIKRLQPAPPWEYGEKIPWNEPEFSARMLQFHLAQDSDWASRRAEFIQRHVDWVSGQLPSSGARVLDLACGPGFYTQILAEQGHRCVGVDFSPASIDYAKKRAAESGQKISYLLQDIRRYESAELFDCVLFVFGEFNVFSAPDAHALLAKISGLLKPGGLFILEGHTFAAVEESGLAAPTWWTCGPGEGLLSDKPHLCLQENYWDEGLSTATTRYFAVNAAGSTARMFCSSITGYREADYERMHAEAGLADLRLLNSEEWPKGGPFEGQMVTMVSRKAGEA